MKKQLITACILMCLTGLASAQTIVTVNGTKIDSKDVDNQVSVLVKESNNQIQDSPQLRQGITNRLITRTLLIQAAKKQQLDKNSDYLNLLKQAEAEAKKQGDNKKPDFNAKWSFFKDDLLTEFYLASIIKNNPVKPEEVQTVYQDFVKKYTGTKEVQLGEIITRDADTANKAVAALKGKQNFSTVAKQYTIDPAGREAGGIPKGYVNLKDLQDNATPVYEAIKNLKKGQYTASPIQGNNGIYAVFYINDIRNLKMPTQSDMTAALTRRLQNNRVNQAIEQLYQSATIKK